MCVIRVQVARCFKQYLHESACLWPLVPEKWAPEVVATKLRVNLPPYLAKSNRFVVGQSESNLLHKDRTDVCASIDAPARNKGKKW